MERGEIERLVRIENIHRRIGSGLASAIARQLEVERKRREDAGLPDLVAVIRAEMAAS